MKSAETAVGSQCLSSGHMMAATGTHAAIEELLEAMLSVISVPELYDEDQLLHTQNLYTSNHFIAR